MTTIQDPKSKMEPMALKVLRVLVSTSTCLNNKNKLCTCKIHFSSNSSKYSSHLLFPNKHPILLLIDPQKASGIHKWMYNSNNLGKVTLCFSKMVLKLPRAETMESNSRILFLSSIQVVKTNKFLFNNSSINLRNHLRCLHNRFYLEQNRITRV